MTDPYEPPTQSMDVEYQVQHLSMTDPYEPYCEFLRYTVGSLYPT
jgi:hypothetical protein